MEVSFLNESQIYKQLKAHGDKSGYICYKGLAIRKRSFMDLIEWEQVVSSENEPKYINFW